MPGDQEDQEFGFGFHDLKKQARLWAALNTSSDFKAEKPYLLDIGAASWESGEKAASGTGEQVKDSCSLPGHESEAAE